MLSKISALLISPILLKFLTLLTLPILLKLPALIQAFQQAFLKAPQQVPDRALVEVQWSKTSENLFFTYGEQISSLKQKKYL